jgi:hypothetical protein
MGSPPIERFSTFRKELVSLIYGRDPGDCASLMIEYFVCYVRSNPEPGHSGHTGPAQIMKAPFGHTGELIQAPFAPAEILKGFGFKH